jgi:hypothetical protein
MGPPATWPPSSATATRIFTWRDDLAFDVTNVPKLRPQRVYRNQNGVVQLGFPPPQTSPMMTPGNPLYVPGLTNAVAGEADLSQRTTGGMGGYSWMVTITPAYDEMGLVSYINPGSAPSLSWSDRHLHTVSVVVFFRRDLTLPVPAPGDQSESSERVVNVVDRNGNPAYKYLAGYGGGDVTLQLASTSVSSPADYLNVKRDDWLLLCGQAGVYHSADPEPDKSTILQYVNYFRWYRIVAVDDSPASIAASPYTRNVTLAGPDWPALPGATVMNTAAVTSTQAVLIKGVVGVYSETMALESNRLWTPVP